MRVLFSLTVLLSLPGVAAAQPYSESMADCAAFYQNAAQWVRSGDRSDALINASRLWHAAALEQSRQEGQTLSGTALWDMIDAKTAVWEARGAGFFLSEEFRDWASYCRKFGKSVGIPALKTG